MRKEVLGLLSVVAFLAAACSAGNERGSADADALLLTATTTTDPAIAVEPANSPVISQTKAGQDLQPGKHTIQGIGAGFIPTVLNVDVI